jgi:hypothetical protein
MDLGTPEIHRTTAEGGCGGLYAHRGGDQDTPNWLLVLAARSSGPRPFRGQAGQDDRFVALLSEDSRSGEVSFHVTRHITISQDWDVSLDTAVAWWLKWVRLLSQPEAAHLDHRSKQDVGLNLGPGKDHRPSRVPSGHGGVPTAVGSGDRRPRKKKMNAVGSVPTLTPLICTSGLIHSSDLTKSSSRDTADCLSAKVGSPSTQAWSSTWSNLALSAKDDDRLSGRLPIQLSRIPSLFRWAEEQSRCFKWINQVQEGSNGSTASLLVRVHLGRTGNHGC